MKHNGKVGIALLVAFIIGISPVYAVTATSKKGGNINVRNGPSDQARVIGQIKSRSDVTVVETEGDWVKILSPDGKSTGYIHRSFISEYVYSVNRLTPMPEGCEIIPEQMTTAAPLGLPARDPVPEDFFSDVVFVGDSVTVALANYVKREANAGRDRTLSQALFLASTSLSAANALWKVSDSSVHPTYNGRKMLVENAIALSGRKKVVIMLGVNDLGTYGVPKTLANYQTLCERILEKCPDVTIYIQSCTPRCEGHYPTYDSYDMFDFDIALYDMSLACGYPFLDVGYALRDERGYLPEKYCSDTNSMRLHLNSNGCAIWAEYLRTHIA